MSKIQPLQRGFHGGQVSPLVEMRSDLDMLQYCVRSMTNMFCHLQGPAETRYGMEWISYIVGGYGRIFDLYVNSYTGFIIGVTPDSILVYDNNGHLTTDDIVINGDFLDDGDNWATEEQGGSQVLFAAGVCALLPNNNRHAQISQELTVVDGDHYEVIVQIAGGSGPLQVDIGTTAEGTDLYSAIHSGTTTIRVSDLVALGTSIFITFRNEAGEPDKLIDNISAFDQDVVPTQIEFASPYPDATDIRFMQVEAPPKENSLFFVTSQVAPYKLSYDVETREWTFGLIAFTAQPAEWGEKSWPSAITFFQGRAYYAGVANDPEGFWGSKPTEYDNMTLGELPDDAVQYSLSKKGMIRWMEGATTLLIGSENGEYTCSAEGGLIIPGDIQVQQQSANGSYLMKAKLAGNNVIYTSPDGRRLKSMGFEWTKEAYLSRDITFMAEGIAGPPNLIVEVYFANSPHDIIWCVTAGGNLIAGTYDALTQSAGFHTHNTQGRIVSICTKRFGGTDELWLLVDRDGDGVELSLEKYNSEATMDAFTSFNFPTPTDTLTGLDHLAGLTCQVIANGAVHHDVVVEPDGTVVLDYEVSTAYVGLGFLSRMETLPRDDMMSLGGFKQGSARHALKRWNKVWCRIISSWKPKINGLRPPERTPNANMDMIEPSATENVQVSTRGWNDEATITIEQDLPVKTVVSGIFGEMDQETVV